MTDSISKKFDWKAPGVLEKFQQLCNEGLSFSQIGARLGISRNAAIGKAMRMKIRRAPVVTRRNKASAQAKYLNQQREARNARKAAQGRGVAAALTRSKVVEPLTEIVIPPEQMVTFDGLEAQHCRWPIGEPDDLGTLRFCGGARVPGASYCECHLQLAHQAVVPRGVGKAGFRLPQRQTSVRPSIGSGQTESPPAAKLEPVAENA